MDVHGYVKPVVYDNDDSDDDAPAIFKRTSTTSMQNQLTSTSKKSLSQNHDETRGSTASKQNQLNSTSTKSLSQNHDETRGSTSSKQNQLTSNSKKSVSEYHGEAQGKPISNQGACNGDSSSSQKNKAPSNAKLSTDKSVSKYHGETRGKPISNQGAHNGESSSSQKNKAHSNAKLSTDKSGAASSNSQAPVPRQSKPLASNSSKGSHVNKLHNEVENFDDSDDDKPLNSRANSVQKANSTNPPKVSKHLPEHKAGSEDANKMILDKSEIKSDFSDDSDDELSLTARFPSSSAAVQKSRPLQTTRFNESPAASIPSQKMNTNIKDSYDDSEDDKSVSEYHGETRGKPISNQGAHNGESSSSQKNKAHSNAKLSTDKSGAASSNSQAPVPRQSKPLQKNGLASNSSKGSHVNKLHNEVENFDDSDDDKPLNSRANSVQKANSTNPPKVSKHLPEHKVGSEDANKMILDKSEIKSDVSDDSDDELPLTARFPSSSAAVQKSRPLQTTRFNESPAASIPSQKMNTNIKDSYDDSEDDKSVSEYHGETRGKPISNQGAHNGESSSSQKNKAHSNAKLSTDKSGAASSNSQAPVPRQSKPLPNNGLASNSSKGSHVNKLHNEVENFDDSDDDKPLNSRANSVQKANSTNPPKVSKHLPEHKAGSEDANKMILDKSEIKSDVSDDSDDELPLTARFPSSSAAVQKSRPLQITRFNESPAASIPSQKMNTNIKDSYDDSEDNKPLTSRLQATPVKKSDSEKKPLSSKLSANGSKKKESSSDLKPLNGLNKRPSGDFNNSIDSSKKAKLSDASGPGKIKNESVVKKEETSDDDDDRLTMTQRMKKSVPSNSRSSTKKVIKKITSSSSFKKDSKSMNKTTKNSQYSNLKVPPGSGGGKKWTTLEHNGVIFPPPYKPHGVKMLYNRQPVDLTPEQEEVATMFAVMKDTDYAAKPKFVENFMNGWRKILGKNHIIKNFELCDFTPIYEWHLKEKEKKKQISSEEKKALKEEKLKQEDKYMWAVVDGVKEKVGNFRVEPPGLFRGRGEHPKMGMLKRRIRPKDISINIGKDAPVPECPIPGERWKEVKHDNSVTWLAFWNDPINPREFKYVFLAASSSLKGQSDKEKYEKARRLKDYIEDIRVTYTKNFTSKDPTKKQIAVATYLIDKLALRAGNEKDDDEADTVGCCTLKVENVMCVPPNQLQFDFLGKDSIRYYNTVEVELPVYKAIGEFKTAKNNDGKKKVEGDDLFDTLDTSKLNAHLKELMPSLTAKVFRTYNASITLDVMLNEGTKDGTQPEKIAVYQHANKEVAIICNHQRSVSKSHDAQMSRLNEKIDELKAQREELKVNLSRARKGKPQLKDAEGRTRNLSPEVLEKKLNQVEVKIEKMELDKDIKEDLKTVALGTSKINYLDPRITVAWCKRNEVPIEKIFNKSLVAKFSWAMDVDPDFRF